MNIKKLSLAAAVSALTFTTATNAVLGPIPIYLNTEYRTSNPVIGSTSSTITISQEDIINSGATTISELLSVIPSIGYQHPHGNVPSVFIRGLETKYNKVLINGIQAPADGLDLPTMDVIPFYAIEKIEIIKGASSALYGGGAIGGIIQIFTKQEVANNDQTTIRSSIGSHNSKTSSISYNSKQDKLSTIINISKHSTDGINAKPRDITGELDGFEKTTKYLSVSYDKNSDSRVSLTHTITDRIEDFDDNSENNAPYSDNNFNSGKHTSNSKQTTLNYTENLSDTVKSNIFYAFSENFRITDPGLYGRKHSKSTATTYGFTNDINIGKDLLVAGWSRDQKTLYGSYADPKREAIETAVFAQYQKSFSDIDAVTTIRHNSSNGFDNVITYNLGLSKKLENGTKLTLNKGKAYKTPSLGNLYGNKGNSLLKAELSTNHELSASKDYTWGSAKLDLYRIAIKDGIKYNSAFCSDWNYYTQISCESASKTWNPEYYSNLSHVDSKGVDFTLSTTLNNWNITGEYNYNISTEGDSTTQSHRRPKNKIKISANKEMNKLHLNIDVFRISSSTDKDWDTLGYPVATLNAYNLLNTSGVYKYSKNIKFTGSINNLTNKTYVQAVGYTQEGRNYNLGVEYKF